MSAMIDVLAGRRMPLKREVSFLTIILLLTACKPTPNGNGDVTPSASPVVPSETLSPTVPLEWTATITPSPSPARTATPTSTPTWTPVATLPREEAFDRILDFYKDNGGCQLPCFWGIKPGVTTLREMHEIFLPLGTGDFYFIHQNAKAYDFRIDVPVEVGHYGTILFTISMQNGIVTGINTSSQWVSRDFDFSLSGLIHTLGEPEEIWLDIVHVVPSSVPGHYESVLFYPSKGIAILIFGDLKREGDTLWLCPQGDANFVPGPPGMLLWSPVERISFKDVGVNVLNGLTALKPIFFSRMQDLTDDMDTKDFYEIYRDPTSTRCIKFNVEDLPRSME
jgi:hypothetical protein